MQIIKTLAEMKQIKQPAAAAIGNFDGVHLGHQALISQCVEESRQNNWSSCVLTFSPHPLQVIAPGSGLKLLNTLEQKIRLIESLGVDYLLLLPFDTALSETLPEDFIKIYLVDLLNLTKVFVGFNFFFGKKGRGTSALLQEKGLEYGFETAVIQPILLDDEVVSSSLVREMYKSGHMEGARRLLGYWPALAGKVVEGDARGRSIGFRTANLELPGDLLLPDFGVYAAIAEIEDPDNPQPVSAWPSVVNIGVRPTFHLPRPTAEAHLLDFDGDLYQMNLRLHLIRKLRAEKRFADMQELGEQIARDIQTARAVLMRE
ncbi:MAG: bifunctional riboflavin kinase/FAD synthetase [Clostridia bacterium]|jgi:riboflavin kinase/FMN adenylyltransferase|nr:bifunctional riboflavin kinase/FAD synthetase [Clostridia bacterium]